MIQLSEEDAAVIAEIIAELQTAWNASDGPRFAAAFAEDGDQVNIFGVHLKDRQEIEAQHVKIFRTIFAQSRNVLSVVDARYIASGAVLAHVRSQVTTPGGPMGGILRTLASVVFVNGPAGWKILTFHNTREEANKPVP